MVVRAVVVVELEVVVVGWVVVVVGATVVVVVLVVLVVVDVVVVVLLPFILPPSGVIDIAGRIDSRGDSPVKGP